MKYRLKLTPLLFLICISISCINAYGQQAAVHAKSGMEAGIKNYRSFTAPYKDNDPEVIKANPGYEHHPEIGLLFAETPCDNCYELIAKRTEISKTYIKEGTNGTKIMQQTSSAPMHYRDQKGNWITIKSQLQPESEKGVYAASGQPVPVAINTNRKFTSLGRQGESFHFNNNPELLYEAPDGSIVSLGAANWSDHTAGDDGVYITNAWPGIDIELFVMRGAVKTNFIINHAMPAYAAGKLLLRDNFQLSDGLGLMAYGQSSVKGNMEIRNRSGETVYRISAASAFEKNDARNTFQLLTYYVQGNTVDIGVPGDYLNRPATSYPVVIDPLVSTSTNSTVTGSTYSPGWTTGCVYVNPATVPAKVTITDVQFSFQYVVAGGAALNNGAFDFKLSTCRSPSPPTIWWNCNSTSTTVGGTCTGTNASIYPSILACLPGPQCASFNMNLTMDFYQNYASTSACNSSYVYAGSPLNITVFGTTVQSATATATPSTICQGQTSSLTGSAQSGVPPYTYTWMPGSVSGSPANVSPATTTTYTLSATDACGDVANATTTVTVSPVSSITGVTQICLGSTTQLTDISTGGTWSSSNSGVATITNTGLVSGTTVGSSVISYITPSTCYATTTVTVNPVPSVISGTTSLCAGGTTMLSNTTAGGNWSSSNTAIATVNTFGMVSGVSGGVATITYSTAAGCYKTVSITVNPTSAITGTTTLCQGNTTALTNASAGGGTWSSLSTTVATVNNSGIVTGVSPGTSVIKFTTSGGCFTTATVMVNPLPSSITGTLTVCQGSNTQLSDATGGGTWSSINPGVATVDINTGWTHGVSGGVARISYILGGTGCATTATVTVYPLGPITGTTTVCVGGSTTLSNIAGTGTWTSSNTTVATITPSTGVVTGSATGTSNITYTSPNGCTATTVVNVSLIVPITGNTTVCQGGSTALSNATTGGTWTSSNTAIAQVISSSGVVAGISGGTATITYSTSGGCYVTASMTVNPIAPISGASSLCQGGSTPFSDATPGGTWSCTNTSIATVVTNTGVVYGGPSGGTTSVIYTTTAGCSASSPITIVALPAPITGNTTICNAGTISDATSGGTWSTGNTNVASVNAGTGAITGIAAGTASITYTISGGCFVTTTVSVNTLAPITGTPAVCAGQSIKLSDATAGGTWSSSNSSIATIDPNNGIASGVTGGSTTISYSTPAGCNATTAFTVNAITPIAGVTTVCQSSSTTLTDGATGGTWSSGSTAIASAGLNTGIISGISPGTTAITYTMPTGCSATTSVNVNPINSVTGNTIVCAGSTTTLSDITTGGTWSSNNSAIATVDLFSGLVSGTSAGNTTISYTTALGCVATTTVTVNILPSAITGNTTICQGSTSTLSDAPTGGTWSSLTTTVATIGLSSGIVNAITQGSSVIVYSTAAGCSATTTVTVNPVAPITGTTAVCEGSTVSLSNTITGGTWSSNNTATATVDINSGDVTGVTGGATNINYTTTQGCVSTIPFTVNVMPTAITGITTICQGSTSTLSNTIGGGTWSSGSTGIATIGVTNGIVTTVNAGASKITYITAAGCYVTTTLTVNPLAQITGNTLVCAGSTTTLSDATAGGTWSSTNTLNATVDLNTGVVTGVAAGVVNISYTTNLGCVATIPVTVSPLPTTIAGNTTVCTGSTSTLSNSITGGTWSSVTAGTATIGVSNGILTGVSAGTSVITYITAAGCVTTTTATVNPLPPAITGIASVCQGSTTTLSDAVTGGTWTNSNISIATIGSNSGILGGVAAGTTSVTYTSPLGCNISTTVTVNPLPSTIIGNAVVCEGFSLTLSNTLAGGTWSSSVPGVATIGVTTGVLHGVSAGTTIISYITPYGCYTLSTATVNPTPVISGFTFTDPTSCIITNGTITLNGLAPGFIFTVNYFIGSTLVSNIYTANSSGNIVITGLGAGTYTNITVTSALGCNSDAVVGPIVLVLPPTPNTPVAANNSPICDGSLLQLTATDATPGVAYNWSGPLGFSSGAQNPVINPATLNQAGTYTVIATKAGCFSSPATTTVVINPIPNISGISSTNPTTCYGSDGTITLSGLTAGVSYFVTYIYNNTPVSITIIANGSGKVVITGLTAGTYSDFSVSSFTCISNSVGPVTLSDPAAPPPPILGSNSPLCAGATLLLTSSDPVSPLIYNWTGPNGYSSHEQNPTIPNVALSDSGTYTLTISHLNCESAASEHVSIYPPVILENVTPDQEMPYGGNVQLNASGADFYLWGPSDGTISNPNIYNPIASPTDSETYVVIGMNQWGCKDSAWVHITINYDAYDFVPSAFTPNGDGRNDVFRIINQRFVKLIDFSVFDRWGKLVYHNTYNAYEGWDGNYNGVPQDMGVYFYSITVETPDKKIKYFKGDVTLIR